MIFRKLWLLVRFRFLLLMRQKLGWLALATGLFLVFIAGRVALASFVNPTKIYWDFSLGLSFVFQAGIAIYLTAQLYAQELERGTLHLVLAGPFSRALWLWSQALGIYAAILLMNLLWLFFSGLYALLFIQNSPFAMIISAQILAGLEMGVVIFLTLFLSLLLRPLLSLVASLVLVIFLHSLSSLQSILTDPQSGAFVENRGLSVILWLARLLPPLEWWDVRPLVGYAPSLSLGYFMEMILIAFLWMAILGFGAQQLFAKKDL